MSGSDHQEPLRIQVSGATFDCVDGKLTTAVSKPDAVDGIAMLRDLIGSPTDWSSSARVTIGEHLFTVGDVTTVDAAGDGLVSISVRSGQQLFENLVPPMTCQHLAVPEIVYAAARSAGFAAEDAQIAHLDQLPHEAFWVVAPVDGVAVQQDVRVGVVEFLRKEAGGEVLGLFEPPLEHEALASFGGESFARVAVSAQTLYDAEEQGLSLIDTAAAWLNARTRYAWSLLPNGALHHYDRTATRITVSRGASVCVQAVGGKRRWWRAAAAGRLRPAASLAPGDGWLAPPMPNAFPEADRQALLALDRAVKATDPIQRLVAVWEAIEFYVGDYSGDPLFAPQEVKKAVDNATAGLDDAQSKRVRDVLGSFLNQRSLMARLREVLTLDGVSVTDEDFRVLGRLRRQRNRAVHGADAAPAHAEIDQAVAFVSRALITRTWVRSDAAGNLEGTA